MGQGEKFVLPSKTVAILKILASEPLYALINYGEPSPTTTKGYHYYELHFQIVTPLELKAGKCLKIFINFKTNKPINTLK